MVSVNESYCSTSIITFTLFCRTMNPQKLISSGVENDRFREQPEMVLSTFEIENQSKRREQVETKFFSLDVNADLSNIVDNPAGWKQVSSASPSHQISFHVSSCSISLFVKIFFGATWSTDSYVLYSYFRFGA